MNGTVLGSLLDEHIEVANLALVHRTQTGLCMGLTG